MEKILPKWLFPHFFHVFSTSAQTPFFRNENENRCFWELLFCDVKIADFREPKSGSFRDKEITNGVGQDLVSESIAQNKVMTTNHHWLRVFERTFAMLWFHNVRSQYWYSLFEGTRAMVERHRTLCRHIENASQTRSALSANIVRVTLWNVGSWLKVLVALQKEGDTIEREMLVVTKNPTSRCATRHGFRVMPWTAEDPRRNLSSLPTP